MIVTICIEVADNLPSREAFCLELSQDHFFVKHVRLPDDQPRRILHRREPSLKPFMLPYLLWIKSHNRILVQYSDDEVLGIARYERWN